MSFHPTSATSLQSNRQPPTAEEVSEENIYIRRISETREAIRGIEDSSSNLQGPITHACQTIENFACSASEWGVEHLRRFQIVVLENQLSHKIYPINYLPRMNDLAIKKNERGAVFQT